MIDLSTGRQAHTLTVDLEPLGDDPTDVWARIATYVTDALRRGTKKNGDMVVFGRVGPGMSPSNEPTTLLYLMFVDSGRRGPSQRQAVAINTALMPLGAWIEGTQIVPDDSVPLFMHVDGEAMRIAICDDAGDWVRFSLDRPEGPWTFVVDVYVAAAGGVPLAELGLGPPRPAHDLAAADHARVPELLTPARLACSGRVPSAALPAGTTWSIPRRSGVPPRRPAARADPRRPSVEPRTPRSDTFPGSNVLCPPHVYPIWRQTAAKEGTRMDDRDTVTQQSTPVTDVLNIAGDMIPALDEATLELLEFGKSERVLILDPQEGGSGQPPYAITRISVSFDNERDLQNCVRMLRWSGERLRLRPDQMILWTWAQSFREGMTLSFSVRWYNREFFERRREAFRDPAHVGYYAMFGATVDRLKLEHEIVGE